jgi:hypothetical protein
LRNWKPWFVDFLATPPEAFPISALYRCGNQCLRQLPVTMTAPDDFLPAGWVLSPTVAGAASGNHVILLSVQSILEL